MGNGLVPFSHIIVKEAGNVRMVRPTYLPSVHGTMNADLKDFHYINNLVIQLQNACKSYAAANCSAVVTSTRDPRCDFLPRP